MRDAFAEAWNRHDIATPRRSLCYCVDRPVWLISNRHLLLTNPLVPTYTRVIVTHPGVRFASAGAGCERWISRLCGPIAKHPRIAAQTGMPGGRVRNFCRNCGELRRHSAVFGSGCQD